MRGEYFIALALQHTLPKGFRRARDYGFLHGNAKRLLEIVRWLLNVNIERPQPRQRPAFNCGRCHAVISIAGFTRALSRSTMTKQACGVNAPSFALENNSLNAYRGLIRPSPKPGENHTRPLTSAATGNAIVTSRASDYIFLRHTPTCQASSTRR